MESLLKYTGPTRDLFPLPSDMSGVICLIAYIYRLFSFNCKARYPQ